MINLIDYYYQMNAQRVIIYYKGPFEDVILNNISKYLKSKFSATPRVGGKVFSIFMEMAENIARYSAEHNYFEDEGEGKGVGTIIIYHHDDGVSIKTGNLISNNDLDDVIQRCQQINQLSWGELRSLRKEVRSKPREDEDKGADIGLIQIALKSENPLIVETQKIDEEFTYFILATEVKNND